MAPIEPRPDVAIFHQSDDVVDLVQYELERSGLRALAFVFDDPTQVIGTLDAMRPAPKLCVLGLAEPSFKAWQLLAGVRRVAAATKILLLAQFVTRPEAWPNLGVVGVIHDTRDSSQVALVVAAEARRILGVPAARIRFIPTLVARSRALRAESAAICERTSLLRNQLHTPHNRAG